MCACMKLYNRCSGSLSIPEMMELSGFSEGEQKLPCEACMDLLFNELCVDNLNALLGWHGVVIGMLKN